MTSELDRQLHQSVLKREAWKEQEFRDKRQLEEDARVEQLGCGGTEMSKAELKKVLDSDRRMYYRTEELNDKLYIHYKGWKKLQNLEGFTGLRALYAECNAFDRIDGLLNCRSLRSLFLQENCIKEISGLDTCVHLWSLNLSSNFITRIEGLSNLKELNSLMLAKNKIGFGGVDDLVHILETNVASLDVQDNRISDPDVLPEVFMQMQDLRVLYLKGNECCKKIPNYRKSTTAYCRFLRYLDDRPVFEDDRRAAEAFNRGGLEEERAERRRMKEEKEAAHKRNMQAFQDMIDRARAEKREREAMRQEDKYSDETDPVESNEQRMRRLQERDKEQNPESYKNEVDERCRKIVEQEKRQAQGLHTKENDSTEVAADTVLEDEIPPLIQEVGEDSEKKVDNRKLVYEDIWDCSPAKEVGEESEEKVDNRKLVYEDIWDDGPAKAPTPAKFAPPTRNSSDSPSPAPSRAKFAPPPRRAAVPTGAKETVAAAALASDKDTVTAADIGNELDQMD